MSPYQSLRTDGQAKVDQSDADVGASWGSKNCSEDDDTERNAASAMAVDDHGAVGR